MKNHRYLVYAVCCIASFLSGCVNHPPLKDLDDGTHSFVIATGGHDIFRAWGAHLRFFDGEDLFHPKKETAIKSVKYDVKIKGCEETSTIAVPSGEHSLVIECSDIPFSYGTRRQARVSMKIDLKPGAKYALIQGNTSKNLLTLTILNPESGEIITGPIELDTATGTVFTIPVIVR